MEMRNSANAQLRVAILARTARQRLNLQSILESNDMVVVADDKFLHSLSDIAANIADVLLVDLDESDEQGTEAFERVIAQANIPVLFNDSAGTRNQFAVGGEAWGRRLAEKLSELVKRAQGSHLVEQLSDKDMPASASDAHSISNRVVKMDSELTDDDIDLEKYKRKIAEYNKPVSDEALTHAATRRPLRALAPTRVAAYVGESGEERPADRVWVLGASIGGPQAVEEFLCALPGDLDLAFVLAQHIGSGFVPLLAEQLDRKCKLRVRSPASGRLLRNGQVVVSPVHQRIVFNHTGHVILKPIVTKTTYSPSIDNILIEVADRFGPRAGAIIFSGMGNDGMKGVEVMRNQGGIVWAQNAESCVVSAMTDAARRTGCVEFSGTPTQLARKLVIYLRKHG